MHAKKSLPIRELDCRGRTLKIGERTLVMGILNVTPDSFSDGGLYDDVQLALRHARQMVADGADLIDIGGESTRPGSAKVSLEMELARVIPVVKALSSELEVPLSIDTYKAEVARQALAVGAHLINDVSGLRADPQMAAVVAEYRCPLIVMHNRPEIYGPHVPAGQSASTNYGNLLAEIISELHESIAIARAAGIADQYILLDPGIGFAKTTEQNLQLLMDLHPIVELGYPVVFGTSRKRFIRQILNVEASDCQEGTATTLAFGISQGCHIMRVHDVKQMKRVAVMSDTLLAASRTVPATANQEVK